MNMNMSIGNRHYLQQARCELPELVIITTQTTGQNEKTWVMQMKDQGFIGSKQHWGLEYDDATRAVLPFAMFSQRHVDF
jgi:hypothetical protein